MARQLLYPSETWETIQAVMMMLWIHVDIYRISVYLSVYLSIYIYMYIWIDR